MKHLCIFILALNASIAFANESRWVKISQSDTTSFYIKPDSLRLVEDQTASKVFVAAGKTVNTVTNKIANTRWQVTVRDCVYKRGKLTVTDLADNFTSEHDFSYGTGNIASMIAGIICDVMLEPSKKNNI